MDKCTVCGAYLLAYRLGVKQNTLFPIYGFWHGSRQFDFPRGNCYTECKAAQTLEKGVWGKVLFQQRHI